MAKYPKTTGQLVTTRIKIDSALNGGRMLLDDQLKEMIDLLWPVGASTPEFFQEDIDWWLELVAQYGIEVAPKDGRLLKVADYPKLFSDGIGYTYGWANSNPGPTTTYTGTDVDGNPITYVHPADLDVAGNALPVPEGTSPAYFRLPNTLARFKREAGEASFVNEWTDTDGNPHAILTEYKAEIGRGQLDAQRGITGRINRSDSTDNSRQFFTDCTQEQIENHGALTSEWGAVLQGMGNDGVGRKICTGINFESSKVTPTSTEVHPIMMINTSLLRVT